MSGGAVWVPPGRGYSVFGRFSARRAGQLLQFCVQVSENDRMEVPNMTIWVDGDALPADPKSILFRAAERVRVPLVLVANKLLKVPPSEFLSFMLVGAGADVVDSWIVDRVAAGDLVVTADIPLASRVVGKGAQALDPRGGMYTDQNVGERLALRDLMADLRGAEMITGGGPPPYTKKDAQRFASQLNNFLSRK